MLLSFISKELFPHWKVPESSFDLNKSFKEVLVRAVADVDDSEFNIFDQLFENYPIVELHNIWFAEMAHMRFFILCH